MLKVKDLGDGGYRCVGGVFVVFDPQARLDGQHTFYQAMERLEVPFLGAR